MLASSLQATRHSAAEPTRRSPWRDEAAAVHKLRGAIGDSVLFHVLQRVGGRDWLGAAQDTPV